ncbi:MAG TPA: helix-turn-helix transcriptional regulator [Blastocatellia bacterium]|nr:helix-turn-helix transcriptional regulator [Blastocatellia bacterium]
MGSRRSRPKRLPEKLLRIREAFGVTQDVFLGLLGAEGEIRRHYISLFETGEREPSVPILLKYARLAGVCLELLVDDELDLPKTLPVVPPHRAVSKSAPPKRH